MKTALDIKKTYKISEAVVAREIQGEFIIIPITSGVGDMEDEIFTLNETGRAIWNELDGKSTLEEVIGRLAEKFEGGKDEIKEDVLGLTNELLKRKMVIENRKK
ncbi:MAG: PqqD family protein [Candidatus Omnitrophota bacterium]